MKTPNWNKLILDFWIQAWEAVKPWPLGATNLKSPIKFIPTFFPKPGIPATRCVFYNTIFFKSFLIASKRRKTMTLVTILNRQETLSTPVWRRNRPKSPPKLPPSVFSTPSNARNLGRILRSCAAPHGYENRLFRSNCLNWLVWSSFFFFFLALLGFLNWCWNTWVWVLCFCSNLELIVFFEFLCFLPFWISQFVLKYIVLETPSIDCFDRVFFFLLGLETLFSF